MLCILENNKDNRSHNNLADMKNCGVKHVQVKLTVSLPGKKIMSLPKTTHFPTFSQHLHSNLYSLENNILNTYTSQWFSFLFNKTIDQCYHVTEKHEQQILIDF